MQSVKEEIHLPVHSFFVQFGVKSCMKVQDFLFFFCRYIMSRIIWLICVAYIRLIYTLPTLIKRNVCKKWLSWLVLSAANSFRIGFLIPRTSLPAGWQIENRLYFDWFLARILKGTPEYHQ